MARAGKADADGIKVLIRNRKAHHDYEISETIEAGIVLLGSEVKSLRDQRVSIAEGWVTIRNREAYLAGAQINEYPWANQFNHEPTRERKLLLHRQEIGKLTKQLELKGMTLVPLAIYIKHGKIKLEIGVGKGKKLHEKRESKKAAEAKLEIARAMRR